MRKVGEINLNQIPSTTGKTDRMYYRKKMREKARNVHITCTNDGCENEEVVSVNLIRSIGTNQFVCWPCKQKGKKEMNEALIALAKRKGLI